MRTGTKGKKRKINERKDCERVRRKNQKAETKRRECNWVGVYVYVYML